MSKAKKKQPVAKKAKPEAEKADPEKKKRIVYGLVAAIVLSAVVLIFQVMKYMKAVEEAGKPIPPSKRFLIHPGAPTNEEIEREERKLQEDYLKAEQSNEKRFRDAAQGTGKKP